MKKIISISMLLLVTACSHMTHQNIGNIPTQNNINPKNVISYDLGIFTPEKLNKMGFSNYETNNIQTIPENLEKKLNFNGVKAVPVKEAVSNLTTGFSYHDNELFLSHRTIQVTTLKDDCGKETDCIIQYLPGSPPSIKNGKIYMQNPVSTFTSYNLQKGNAIVFEKEKNQYHIFIIKKS